MTPPNQIALIAQIPLFATLPSEELERLSAMLQPCEFTPGALLLREGESDDYMFILLEGEVEVIKALDTPDERHVGLRPAGSLFGEMSLFDPRSQHTASVRAYTPVRALQMSRQDFDALLHRQPALAYGVVRLMSLRLEQTENATILDLRIKNELLTQAYRELQAAQEQIIIKEKLEQELAIARQIQASILPESLPLLSGFEIAAKSVPARAVGGDYYDFIPLEGERIGLVVGDACDKGMPAALMINLANSLVRVEALRNPSPEASLRQVNHHLLARRGEGLFVSMLYGVLDVATGQFDYCRAGHPYPLILDSENHLLEVGSNPGMPLGIEEEVQLDAQSASIPRGGVAVIYSDGLTEAVDPGGNEFGADRLASVLAAISHLPAEEICARLWSLVQEFSREQPQSDDFTVIVIKRAS